MLKHLALLKGPLNCAIDCACLGEGIVPASEEEEEEEEARRRRRGSPHVKRHWIQPTRISV